MLCQAFGQSNNKINRESLQDSALCSSHADTALCFNILKNVNFTVNNV